MDDFTNYYDSLISNILLVFNRSNAMMQMVYFSCGSSEGSSGCCYFITFAFQFYDA
jgi:hypothetical protein